MNTKAYWIAFNQTPGIGPVRLAALLEVCGSIEAAWKASTTQLREAGLNRRTIEGLLALRSTIDLAAEWQRVQQMGIQVLTWDDDAYPLNLSQTEAPPPILYVQGELETADIWSIAVVGTRRASAYGREVAHAIGVELARHGLTVVSGLALGVDTIAHQAALETNGRTVAVLGSSLDHLYPPQNQNLAQRIMRQGAVISEYPLGTRPEANNFPPRNRIISGLSKGTIVVEAGERSGALITARFAAEQGQDVFAVPGSILHRNSIGCNQLIQKGALLYLSIEDILEQLNLTRLAEQRSARRSVTTDPLEAKLLEYLSGEPKHIDEIVRLSTWPSHQVSSLLTVMELKGFVRQASTMCYVLV